MLPLWFLLAAGVASWQPSAADQRAAIGAGAILLMLAVRAGQLGRVVWQERGNRLATGGGGNTGRLRQSSDGLLVLAAGSEGR
jgi:hypothetical protein